MKGVRFYLEYPNAKEKNKATRKELGNHKGTIVAVFYKNNWIGQHGDIIYGCLAGIFDRENSPVCGGNASKDCLDIFCKRISEKQAREIHPALFIRLDEKE